jgi:hypothetical protein
MGNLKPGATYIYERQGGTVYAREMGAPAEDRIEIGYDWNLDKNPARVQGATRESILENQLWYDIRQAAKTNPALQTALDHAKILYHLSKKDGKE